MEKLKPLKKLCEPDPFQKEILLYDEETGTSKPLTLRHIYNYVNAIKLDISVPRYIRSHFERAKSLLVYSWFVFPFAMSAQLHAYITVELALKQKTGTRRMPFRALLRMAVERDWISDEEFSSLMRLRESRISKMPPEMEGYIDNLMLEESNEVFSYSNALSEAIPRLRNELAHGTDMIHDGAFQSVSICAEVINQLFRKGSNET